MGRSARARANISTVATLSDDRDEIRDLYARYCLLLDAGAAAGFAALYTDDGEFHGGGDHVVGRRALEEYATRLAADAPPGTLHRFVANLVIDVDVDGSWRIARRDYIADGA